MLCDDTGIILDIEFDKNTSVKYTAITCQSTPQYLSYSTLWPNFKSLGIPQYLSYSTLWPNYKSLGTPQYLSYSTLWLKLQITGYAPVP